MREGNFAVSMNKGGELLQHNLPILSRNNLVGHGPGPNGVSQEEGIFQAGFRAPVKEGHGLHDVCKSNPFPHRNVDVVFVADFHDTRNDLQGIIGQNHLLDFFIPLGLFFGGDA